MKKLLLITLSILYIAQICQGQPAYDLKRDHNWVFSRAWGGNDIPNHDAYEFIFSDDTLKIEIDSFNTTIRSASIALSDKAGQLILYSNGCAIYGNDNEIIINGSDLNQGYFNNAHCPDGVINTGGGLLLLPVNDSTYYLIYQRLSRINEILTIDLVYYSKIQKLAGDQFSVVEKDQILGQNLDLISGQTAIGRHANGKDWWLIFMSYGVSKLVFLLDENGFKERPKQDIGNMFARIDGASGTTLLSPDGTKMVSYNAYSDLHIFDYDRCTGKLSNPISIPIKDDADAVLAAGAAISPNSRFVYLPSTQHVYQYDLWADNIEESREVIAIYDDFRIGRNLPTRFYQAQLAPDGRIYIGTPSNRGVWHVVEKPNEKGLACKLEQHKIVIPVGVNTHALPQHPNFRLGPMVDSPCDTLGIPSQLSITAHPYNQLVCAGGVATHFEVTAHGKELSYQWQSKINDQWEDIEEDSLFSDSKTHDLQLAYTDRAMEGWQFRCIVVSDIGRDTTNAAMLNLSEQETIRVDFDVKINEDTVDFINLSQHAASYFWTFGDGTYDTIPNPEQKVFSQDTYIQKHGLELFAENECSSAYITDTITVEIPKAIARFEVEPNFSCNVGDTLYVREISENRHRIINKEWRLDCCYDLDFISETSDEALYRVFRGSGLFPGNKELELQVCDLIGCDTVKLDTAFFYFSGDIEIERLFPFQLSDRNYSLNCWSRNNRDVENYKWYFDDGTLIQDSNQQRIEIEFPKDSVYTIICEASSRCSSDRDTITLDIRTTSLSDKNQIDDSFEFYPNPASDILYLVNKSTLFDAEQILFYDALGRLVKTAELSSSTIASYEISISDLTDGIYFLRVSSEQGVASLKPLVVS